jgi:hypothetical protein
VRFDYPFEESIRSLLPLVDELVINVGVGDDATAARIEALRGVPGGEKIITFESVWPLDDPEKRRGGRILSEQTNLALDRCTGDWCLYLQADEVLHEQDAAALRSAFEQADARPEIDGLLFDYVHFYGSFDVVQVSRSAYRREVRAIRRSSGARSVGDAQSFRKADGSKPRVLRSGARVFHYGWVRTPEAMREKTLFMDGLYHGAPGAGEPATGENYRYKRFWGLRTFEGTHPAVMGPRIASKGWHWDLARSPFAWSWSDGNKVALDLIERLSGRRLFEYRSYELVEDRK